MSDDYHLCFLMIFLGNETVVTIMIHACFVCVVTDPCFSKGVLSGAQFGATAADEPPRSDTSLLAQRGLTEQ